MLKCVRKRNFLNFCLYFDFFVTGLTVFHIITRHTNISSPVDTKYCNWNVSTVPTSTKNDVVLLYGTSLAQGLRLCYKSLRSTGAKCRIILFLPHSLEIPKLYQDDFDEFNIEVVRITPNKYNNVEVPHMDRYYHEYEWLQKNVNKTDRVLHTDAYDVFFQGDPFSNVITSESISYAIEPHQFKSCGWNQMWVSGCYGDQTFDRLYHNFIICSGTIGGPSYMYLKLLELMTKSEEWVRCWKHSNDQPILNFLHWTGKVEEAGIKYKYYGCNDGLFTMQWCVKEHRVLYNEHGQVQSIDGAVPPYVHQYNRFPSLQSKLFYSCDIH